MTITATKTPVTSTKVLTTGLLSLDIALGIGGLPRGSIVEVFGAESTGKTALALHWIAALQRQKGVAAFVDAECALDPAYARRLGIDLSALLVSQPGSGEQALRITTALIRSGVLDLIVIDSIAALAPKSSAAASQAGSKGLVPTDARADSHRRFIARALDSLIESVKSANTTVVLIDQIRTNPYLPADRQRITTGGSAVEQHASIRLNIRRISPIVNDEEIVGIHAAIKIVKNLLFSPLREARFEIRYPTGISREADVIDQGVKYGVVKKSGSYLRYGAEILGRHRDHVRAFLFDNPHITDAIEREVRDTAFDVGETTTQERSSP